MTYHIIPTTEEYLGQFWSVLDQVARERLYLAFLEGPAPEKFQAFVLGNIQQNAPQFLAIADNKVVGWCDITRNDRPIHVHCGTLGIGVLKEYRGQGIGLSLMKAALEKAKRTQFKRIELTVREANIRALDLYKKLGFQVEGIKRNSVLIEGIYEDIIFMGLLLEE